MLVETYEETEPLTEQVEAEALSLMEECGLTGQLAIHRDTDDNQTFIPYRKIKEDEIGAIKAFFNCDSPTDISKYNAGPIPIEVLKVIALCKQSNWFDHFQIYHDKAHNPDPVLIGRKGSSYSGEVYILARWGDALMPWPEFIEIATERHTEKCLARAKSIINELKSYIEFINGGEKIPVTQSTPSSYDTKIS